VAGMAQKETIIYPFSRYAHRTMTPAEFMTSHYAIGTSAEAVLHQLRAATENAKRGEDVVFLTDGEIIWLPNQREEVASLIKTLKKKECHTYCLLLSSDASVFFPAPSENIYIINKMSDIEKMNKWLKKLNNSISQRR